jgi:hypothetical protein
MPIKSLCRGYLPLIISKLFHVEKNMRYEEAREELLSVASRLNSEALAGFIYYHSDTSDGGWRAKAKLARQLREAAHSQVLRHLCAMGL